MEKNQIIIESQLRSIIREELQAYLIEEGVLDAMKAKVGKLKSLFAPAVVVALLATQTQDSTKVLAQQKQELTSEQALQQFEQMIDTQQQKLKSFGITDDGAEQIIAGIISGVRKQKEKEQKYSKLTDEEKEAEILKLQQEELSKLNDIKVVKDVLLSKFQNEIEQDGRSLMVSSSSQQGQIGAPVPIQAFVVGLGKEVQDTLMQHDEVVATKSKNKEGREVLALNPMNLKSYWSDLLVDNSPIKKELQKELGTIYIPASSYEYAAGEMMQKYVSQQLQKENKVTKLKKRLNELRGLYV
jgi:hypothetical protein